MHRRGGRTAWLPAFLLWIPVLLLGLVFMTALDVDVDPVGDQQRVRVELPAITQWIDDTARFGIGVGLAVVGLVLFGLSRWEPAPGRLPGVVTVYPWFQAAALFFVVAFLFALWVRDADAFDASAGGVQWRFLLDTRAGVLNQVTAGIVAVASVVTFLAGIGRARFSEIPSTPSRGPPTEPPEDAPVAA